MSTQSHGEYAGRGEHIEVHRTEYGYNVRYRKDNKGSGPSVVINTVKDLIRVVGLWANRYSDEFPSTDGVPVTQIPMGTTNFIEAFNRVVPKPFVKVKKKPAKKET